VIPLLMRADGFPSSAAFDEIARSLSSSDADRKDAIKTGNAIFAFTLKNHGTSTSRRQALWARVPRLKGRRLL
jgi:hypothetical protein